MHTSLEVITPAACMDLTVLSTVKTELGIPQSDTSKDDQLSMLIKQASGIVADYCDMVFGAEELVETFWSDWPYRYARSFMLSREPVVSIESVEIDGVVLDPSQYRLASDNHVHRLDGFGIGMTTWHLISTAVIHYTAGYVLLDNLPYGIERAALALIKDYYFSTGSDPRVRTEDIPGVRSVSYTVGGGSFSSDIQSEVATLLAPYRRLAFA